VNRHLIGFGLILLIPLTSHSQFRAEGYVGSLVDDNAFNNYLQIKDRLTEASLTGAYEWELDASAFQVSYTGSLHYFSLFPGRTFQQHEAGAAYSYLVNEESGALVNAGASLSVRDNHEEYDVFDHSLFSLYANMQTAIFEGVRIKGGYTFRSVSFSSLAEFAYAEHYAFVQGGLTLPTRTTFILQGDLGFKNYSTPNAVSTSASADSLGNGRRSSNAPLPGVTQFLGTLRIGQGIADGTGLSVTGQYQVNLRKESRFLSFSDGMVTDDEFFDDHYGYEGPSGTIMLTHILPADMRLRFSGTLQQREYADRPAYDLAGNQVAAQRTDHRSVLSLSLEKSFPALGLTTSLTYDRITNASNDFFYSYHNNALSLRLSVGY
jgi:hypothetical protein